MAVTKRSTQRREPRTQPATGETVFPYDDEVRNPYEGDDVKNPHEETSSTAPEPEDAEPAPARPRKAVAQKAEGRRRATRPAPGA